MVSQGLDLGLQPDALAYNTLINGQSKGFEWRWALFGAQALRRRVLEASKVTHTDGLTACGGCRKWSQALDVLKSICPILRVDAVMYSTMVSAMTEAWELGLQVGKGMLLQHLEVDMHARNTLLSIACGKPETRWASICDQLLKLRRAGLQLELWTLKVASCELAESGRWPLAVHALSVVRQESLQDDLAIYGSAVHACVTQWGRSLQLLQSLSTSFLEVSTVIFGAVLAACGMDQKWAQSSQLLAQLHQRMLEVSTVAQNAFLSSCRQAQSWKAGLALTEATKPGLQLDIISSGAFLSACRADWGLALQQLEFAGRSALQTGAQLTGSMPEPS